MKRLCSSDSKDGDDQVSSYAEEFQAMLDEEGGCIDESGHPSAEKKRRLSVDQVKALEKNFEVENKLEPERKLKLALELGLQPRQVAVWFQNRRARWKTKQLERDYGALKADYDGLKLSCEKLQLGNESLLNEIRELKARLSGEDGKTSEPSAIIKEDQAIATDQENDPKCEETAAAATEMEIVEHFNDDNVLMLGFKDGSSDSDSSAILNSNEDSSNLNNSPQAAFSSSAAYAHRLMGGGANLSFNVSSSLPFNGGDCSHNEDYFVKIEEENFLGHDEDSSANIMFSDDDAPSLPWICSDEWN